MPESRFAALLAACASPQQAASPHHPAACRQLPTTSKSAPHQRQTARQKAGHNREDAPPACAPCHLPRPAAPRRMYKEAPCAPRDTAGMAARWYPRARTAAARRGPRRCRTARAARRLGRRPPPTAVPSWTSAPPLLPAQWARRGAGRDPAAVRSGRACRCSKERAEGSRGKAG